MPRGGTSDAGEEGGAESADAKQLEHEMEEAFLEETPKPVGWLPTYFLFWILFGPLSSSPGEDFTMNDSFAPTRAARTVERRNPD